MKHTRSFPITALVALVALATFSACDSSKVEAQATPATTVPAVAKHEPTSARALERSQDRWAKMAKGDWVSVHDMLVPEMKADQPLAKYLSQTQFHKYENAKVFEVVAIDKDMAFVRSMALWTPMHPEVSRVKLEPGQTLTQEIRVIESWRWVGGDWCFVRMEREGDFFQEHPEHLKSGKVETPAK